MKREDIIDSMEYIEEDFLKEADQVRQINQSVGDSGKNQSETGKIRAASGEVQAESEEVQADFGEVQAESEKIQPVSGKGRAVTRKNYYARRWGTLVAGLAVFIVAAFVMTTVLRDRSRNMEAMQSAQVEVKEDRAGQRKSEEAADAAAEEDTLNEAADTAAEEYTLNEAAESSAAGLASPKVEGAVPDESAGMTVEDMAPDKMDAAYAEKEAAGETEMRIRVTSEAGDIVFALNDSPAAQSLVSQLPLSVDTEPYSSNEIVFHPEEPLDTENGIEGGGRAGYLGYFAPWDNIVMYYGDFEAYPGLYILGEAVSGAEYISEVSGTVTIDRA